MTWVKWNLLAIGILVAVIGLVNMSFGQFSWPLAIFTASGLGLATVSGWTIFSYGFVRIKIRITRLLKRSLK